MKETLKKIWPDALVVVALLLVSLCYFIGPVSQGLTLGGHDYQAATGLGREQAEYLAQSGEQTRWTNAVFGGMPTYQTAPSYKASHVLGFFSDIYALGTSGVVSYVFLYLLGFYILMRAFGFRPLLSVLGAVAWAFSSYFFIIITAGHIWKVLTLAFIPPTIAGLVLCYRGRLLWGGAVTALFTAFQVLSNHVQMTYYFLFVMLFIVVAYGIDAARRGTWRGWLKATGVVVAAGVLGILANLPNLYHTYEYSKESTRGRAELSPLPGAAQQAPTDGLDRNYITQWSYGLDETLTLLVPNYKGGGSASVFDMPGADEKPEMAQLYQYAGQAQQSLDELGSQNPLPGLSQYWGDQPMTVGPVYVGAFIVFLFILGLFYVRGPMKWALAASTVLSLLFAWGRNLMPVTDFFIDWLPMYSKFRTVSSALVIAEFTIPLLAVLCLARLLREPDLVSRRPAPFIGTLAVTGGFCLLLWLFPGMAGNCLSAGEADAMSELSRVLPPDFIAGYTDTIATIRHGVLRADALRSLLIILVGAGLLWLYLRRKLGGTVVTACLAVLCLFDLWQVDKRYLNDGLFSLPTGQARTIDPTPADEQILADKDPDFRVLNLSEGKPFNESSNRTSYFHKSIGGYHPAKLPDPLGHAGRHVARRPRHRLPHAQHAQHEIFHRGAGRAKPGPGQSARQRQRLVCRPSRLRARCRCRDGRPRPPRHQAGRRGRRGLPPAARRRAARHGHGAPHELQAQRAALRRDVRARRRRRVLRNLLSRLDGHHRRPARRAGPRQLRAARAARARRQPQGGHGVPPRFGDGHRNRGHRSHSPRRAHVRLRPPAALRPAAA